MIHRTLHIRSKRHYVIVEVAFEDTATMVDVLNVEHAVVSVIDSYALSEIRQTPTRIESELQKESGYTVRIVASQSVCDARKPFQEYGCYGMFSEDSWTP